MKMFNKKYILRHSFQFSALLLAAFVMIMGVYSCKKNSPYYNEALLKTPVYNGDVIKYLESQNGRYDSMLVVLKRYPDIVQMLTSGSDSLTFYAIPNAAFEAVVKSFNERRRTMDSASLSFSPNNLNRADSGMFQYDVLKNLISMYIFKGIYDYNSLAVSSTGFNTNSINGYQMNQMAIQESASGSTFNGPKRIQLSDMNNSPFMDNWKSVTTTSSSTVLAGNVLVHTLSDNHLFGFASFNDKLMYPTISRFSWKPIAWHSIMPDREFGGTVFHAIDGSLNTEWRTVTTPPSAGYTPPPKPWWFIIDMGKVYDVGGFTIQHRNDLTAVNGLSLINNIPTRYYVQFAKDNATNLNDPAAWYTRTPEYFVDVNYSTYFQRKSFRFTDKINARYFRFVVVRNWHANATVDGTFFTHLGEIWMDY